MENRIQRCALEEKLFLIYADPNTFVNDSNVTFPINKVMQSFISTPEVLLLTTLLVFIYLIIATTHVTSISAHDESSRNSGPAKPNLLLRVGSIFSRNQSPCM